MFLFSSSNVFVCQDKTMLNSRLFISVHLLAQCCRMLLLVFVLFSPILLYFSSRTVTGTDKTVKCQVCFIILEQSQAVSLHPQSQCSDCLSSLSFSLSLSLSFFPFFSSFADRLYPSYSACVNVSSLLTGKVLSPVKVDVSNSVWHCLVLFSWSLLDHFGSTLYFTLDLFSNNADKKLSEYLIKIP